FERGAATLCGRRRPLVALDPRPRLRLGDERPQLLEQRPRRGAVALERLDAPEPSQHRPRLVHVFDGTGAAPRLCADCVTFQPAAACTAVAYGAGRGRRPRIDSSSVATSAGRSPWPSAWTSARRRMSAAAGSTSSPEV